MQIKIVFSIETNAIYTNFFISQRLLSNSTRTGNDQRREHRGLASAGRGWPGQCFDPEAG